MADEGVVLKPVSFNPFSKKADSIAARMEALTPEEVAADQADATSPASKAELLREMGRKDLAPGAHAILAQHFKQTFGEEPPAVPGNRGAQITAERRRGPAPVFPLEGEQKPSVTLQPVNFDPFAAVPGKPSNLADVGHGLKIGADIAAQDVRELVGRVPGIGPSIVAALDRVDEAVSGKPSGELLKADIEAQTKAQSPEQQAAGQKRWDTLEPDSAWRDWRSYTGGLAQSIPEQAVTMFPAMRLAKGAYAASIAKGMAPEAAGAAAARTATVAGGALEGALGGAQSSRQVRDDILALKEPELQDSEALKTMMAGGLGFDQARAQLADDAATKAFFLAGVATGIFGGMGDRALAKAMTGQLAGGVAKRAAKGAVAEGVLEELPQSGLQQASQNVAMQAAVPSTEITKDVANQALGGLAVGALQGGAQTAAFGRASAPQEPSAAGPSAPPNPGAQAAPEPVSPAQAPSAGASVVGPTAGAPAAMEAPILSPIDQARADAQVLKAGGDLAGADETRSKNATLLAVYGENAAVRHVIDAPGSFSAIGDAMLMAAPTVERVRATIGQGQEARDITPEILGAIDELAKIRTEGKTVAQIMAHADVSFEGQQLIQFLDENATNSKKIAGFLEQYLQAVEDASGVPSKTRGRAFDIIEERAAARRKADEAGAIEQKKAEEKRTKDADARKASAQAQDQNLETELIRAKAAGSGHQPEHRTAMEIAFANATKLRGKSSAKSSPQGAGAVPAGAASAPQAGSGQVEGPAAQRRGALPQPHQADHRGEPRPVREERNQEGAGRNEVNRGAKIAAELQTGDGTRENPVIVTRPKHITAAAARAAAQPTSAQKAADNYAKGHFRFADTHQLSGLGVISIETAKGNERTAHDGTWSVPNMPAHYGHLQIAEGNDGDKADITVGDELGSKKAFVIDQIDPTTKRFDETKSFVGFPSQKAVEAVYVKSFTDGKGRARIGTITEMTLAQYVARAQSNGLKAAVAYQEPEGLVDVPVDTHEMLRIMAANTSWVERGGMAAGSQSAVPIKGVASQAEMNEAGMGRTVWVGAPEWAKGSTEAEIKTAVEKAIAGKPLGVRQRSIVQDMLDDLAETRAALSQADGEALPAAEQAEIFTAVAIAVPTDAWSTMSEEEKNAELDAVFGTEKPLAQGEESRAPTTEGEVRPAEAAGREPGSDDEEVAPARTAVATRPEQFGVTALRGMGLTASKLKPNTLYILSGHWEGYTRTSGVAEQPYEGDPRAAFNDFAARNPQATPQAIIATNAAGKPSKVLPPTGGPAIDFNSAQGQYVLGDVDAYRKDAQRRIEEGRSEADPDKVNAAVDERVRAMRDRIEGSENGLKRHQEEYASDLAKRKAGVTIKDRDDRFSTWKEYLDNSKRITEALETNLARERTELAAWEAQRVRDVRPALELQSHTPADVAAKAAQAAAQAAQSAAESVKAAVDEMRGAFTLTGSNRTADEGAARGQQDLLATKPQEAITDFGEKIGGARKDVWATFRDKMKAAQEIDIAAEPLSKSWPEPDYQGLLDAGADKWAVAFMHAARDALPPKPRASWKVDRWAGLARTLRDITMSLANGTASIGQHSVMAAIAKMPNARGVQDIAGRVELYETVGHSKSLAGVRVSSGDYSLFEGKEYNPPKVIWTVQKDAVATAMSNWPRILSQGATKEESIAAFKTKYASLEITPPTARETTFDIFSKRTENGYWIGKKIGRNPILLHGPIANIKEARTYKEEHHDELVAKLEKAKEIPSERRDTNNPRVGEDMRQAQDVTPQMFGETFGFRGVEFGNYVEQGKRQQDLNEAFDALMDMAAILNVPPLALSLNGELGLAFGARGTGGIRAAKAHYEPGHIVINLTKREGAGSLGHEWWHALDNYFSRLRGKKTDYTTEALDVSLASRGSKYVHAGEVRKEMIDAYGDVVRAIRETAIKARSAKLDAKRSNQYWTTGREMSARAYESYLISKLQDQNASNDYLANVVDEKTWKAAESLGFELDDSYPYPTAGEVPKIRAAFDHFFSTVQTKETDGGVAMFSRQADNIERYAFQRGNDKNGQPAFANGEIILANADPDRLTRGEGVRSYKWNIYDRTKPGEKGGRFLKVGVLYADLTPEGKFEALRGITIYNRFRDQGFGYGESTVASMLASNGRGTRMAIVDIVHSTPDPRDNALPFWLKMGTRQHNLSNDPNVEINGDLSLSDYLQARGEKGKFFRDGQADTAQTQPTGRQAGPQGNARAGEARADAGRERGGEEVLGRKPGALQGLTPSAVRQAVEPILEKWGNAPEVVVLGSIAEAPEAVRKFDEGQRSQGATGSPSAFFWGGKAYLVANEFRTLEAAQAALFHEVLGHAGLRGAFGDKLNPILDRVAFDFRDRVAAKAASYGFDVKTVDGRRQAAEEVLAELAQTRPQHSLVKRLIAAIRQFLRDTGIDLKLSDADLVANYIAPARGFVERGQAQARTELSAAFSRTAEALPSGTFASARDMFDTVTRSDRTLNRLISKFNTPFHIAETHPEFKPVYEEAQDFNQDVSRVANETADRAPDLLPRIESFSDFKKSAPSNEDISTVANALYGGTLWGGGSPLEGRVWTDAELRSGRSDDSGIGIQVFDPLNEAQIKLYRQALASVGHSLTEHARSLAWRLAKQMDIRLPQSLPLARMVAVADELAETQALGKGDALRGADDETAVRLKEEIAALDEFRKSLADIQAKTEGLIEHGYFPAMRFGQYAVNVQSRGVDDKWKSEYFGRFETQTAANVAKAELEKEFPKSQVTSGVMNDEAHKLFQGLNLDALELFSQHMKDDSGKAIAHDPVMQEFFRVATTERSSLKRQIHRKGTPGFSRDVPRALAQFTVANATSASRNFHAADMLAKVQKIKAGDLQAYATRYVRYLQDPQEESPALRGFLANYYILGSIAFGAVNMTQPILMTAPYLSAHTSWVNAMAQLGRAAKDLVAGRKDLTEDEKAAYAKATKAGIVSPQEIHQIRAESRASMMGDSPGWQKLESIAAAHGVKLPGKLLMRKAALVWGSVYAISEQFNRGITFLAAYRIGRANNADAYEFAKNAVNATQGVYNRGNRPEVSRGPVGSTIMTFRQFSIAYLELAKRLYGQDKKAFAVLMLTLIALAGAEGLPFAEDVEDLIDTIGQWMGYPTNAKKALRKVATDLLGKEIADVLLHGASAIPGVPIDVSNRLGMQNIIPGSALLKTSEPDKTRDIVDLLGPAASLFKNTGSAIEGLATGKSGDTKLLLPMALQNVFKGAEMVETGQYRDMKGRKVMDVDAVDAFAKLIGFQPAKVARETRIVGQNQQDIALHKVIEDSIASKWAHGMVDKDSVAVADAVRQWKDWNEINPSMPIAISASQIARRIKELQTSREERFTRSAPKEIRGDVRQDLRQ